ncbi:nucleotidyltransferase family protein [Pseudorhodoplanes sp.]|uniref:nucleotidyltransferase family protein n=1 Tax=Pseudorhodoplanes sp. TaxID=1934341 RepID=UPI003D0A5B88
MNGGPPRAFPGLVIVEGVSIRDAIQAIETNGREMVLVCDSSDRIVGLISDGDVRRALLSGRTLDMPASDVMTRDFFTVAPEIDRASVLDVMMARSFPYVPVLDHDGRLIAVHFLRDLMGATRKPNVAVVMAGGRGTRLRPVTEAIPKPMIEVAGRPMLERIVLHLVGHGIQTIYIAVNFMADVIERHFGDGRALGCRIEYLRETTPLGTGGALALLPERPAHPFLVLNADLVSRANLTAMLDAHMQRQHAATIGVGPYQVQIPFGTVREQGGRLLSIAEKPTLDFLINRGIYVLDPSALDHVPHQRDFPITDLFEALLAARKNVGVFNFDDPWIDVGHFEDLRRAQGG